MPVLLLFFRQVKPALWKAPLVLPFFVDLGKFLLFIEIFSTLKFLRTVKVFARLY